MAVKTTLDEQNDGDFIEFPLFSTTEEVIENMEINGEIISVTIKNDEEKD